MTNTAERIAALPRARKGDTVLLIIEEHELLQLISDAVSTSKQIGGSLTQAAQGLPGMAVHNGGSTAAMVVHYDPPQPPPNGMGILVEGLRRRDGTRRPMRGGR